MYNNEKGVSAIVLIIIAVFVLGGAAAAVYYVQSNQSGIEDAVEEARDEQASQTSDELPSLYAQAGLPVPDGTITKKRQGRDLSDGVQVTWETSDSIVSVKSFFDTEMTSRGFTLPSSNIPVNEFSYLGIYKNGDKQFTLTITKIGDTATKKIHVNYHE